MVKKQKTDAVVESVKAEIEQPKKRGRPKKSAKNNNAELVDTNKSIDDLIAIRRQSVLTEREKESMEGWRLTANQQKELAKIKVDLMLADITPLAIEKELMLLDSDEASPELQHKVAESLLNRGFGKPTQQVEQNVEGSIKISLSPDLDQYSN